MHLTCLTLVFEHIQEPEGGGVEGQNCTGQMFTKHELVLSMLDRQRYTETDKDR